MRTVRPIPITKKLLQIFLPENAWGDNLYHLIDYIKHHKRLPNNRSFNKLLYDVKTKEANDPLRVFVTDKELAKIYIQSKVKDAAVPTLAVLKNKLEVESFTFPNSCCIKPTHLSGEVILRTFCSSIDYNKIYSWFDSSHYLVHREGNYKYLRPKVIVEPLLFNNKNVNDYKFFCYNGKIGFIQVDINRYISHTRKLYSKDWVDLNFSIIYQQADCSVERPKNLEKMLDIVKTISEDFDGFVRIDLYSDGNETYVGEITNCSENASGNFIPESAEDLALRLLLEDYHDY